ncbi:DUF488 domain-containing protein [Paramaledivibacter caminithermalis]|jgi:uncharacterized protein (DUF488 family)|uniref:DUF488 domain-containing protein n=1 Tax=Paramaledivibacter caminithermalis (strain DSM 15212 / CIP 107654 / DViRD3) TaxID=1121301 RepID=A0A1M6M914_PARC5|nr:DUF488 domain-containing protein [Paramaledivibacter caminithermalis]SHJ79946.1 Protein of unknown function, DUF488 [Paramaledivibacter caminithermalis DSM 15212]
MNILYTIGHSNLTTENFLKLLRKYGVNCVVDVRSTPYSKFTPQFNEIELKNFLNQNGVYYIGMGREFGARRNSKNLYTMDGYLDFEKVKKDADFILGVNRIKKGVKKGYHIAFMCTEKNAIDCHRNILVAKYFYDLGYDIKNINHNGDYISQEEINELLLDMYFPRRNEISLFDSENLSDEELLKEAYKKRNKDIGYSINNEE